MNNNILYDKALSFSIRIVNLFKYLNKNGEHIMSKQLLRSGTSIGANVSESVSAES
ncbi:MAG: four helix bundle protein, partial [Bacteroidaceae bacterium]|nr:four helix bundle protein [Bacteroidaceae bacterium]